MKSHKYGWTIPLLLVAGLISCRHKPAVDQPIKDAQSSAQAEIPTENLKILPGMKIKLRQKGLGGEENISLSDQGVLRTLKMENAIGAEGITFQWSLHGGDAATKEPESQPNKGSSATSKADLEGRMTLANLVGARQMTLPAFWPEGELYLSNSSAIWLSDQAFQELKKNHETTWQLGLSGDNLIGPAQGFGLVVSELKNFQQTLEKRPEDPQNSVSHFEGGKKIKPFPLKINGQAEEVEALEAANGWIQLKILNNPQNPLILEVQFQPKASAGQMLFSPLTLLKPFLEYRVEEIDLPTVGNNI